MGLRKAFSGGGALLSLVMLACPLSLPAETLELRAGDITAALGAGGDDGSTPTSALLAPRLTEALASTGVLFENGQLVSTQRIEDLELSDGCTRQSSLDSLVMEAVIDDATRVSLTVTNIDEPLALDLDVSLKLRGEGDVSQRWGARLFGHCSFYADDDFTFTVDASLRLKLQLVVTMHPEVVSEDTLRLNPAVQVAGEVSGYDYRVDVDDTLISRTIEKELEDGLDGLFAGDEVDGFVADLQGQIEAVLYEKWQKGELDLKVADLSGEEVAGLYKSFNSRLSFGFSESYFNAHRAELLLAMLEGDSSELANALACDATRALMVDLPHAPLYARQGGVCMEAGLSGDVQGRFFADAQCRHEVVFESTSLDEYCESTVDRERFGNAADLVGKGPVWTLNPGTRVDLALESIAGNEQSYMMRRLYREVQGDKGLCQLEMRVYSPSPGATGLKPLLAFHGGSWRYRGAGYAGLEAQVSHFTDEGFVVFVPFYRLTGEVDGNAACNGADGDAIVSDAQAALAWVQEHAGEYGVAVDEVADGISVTGQSAGAYLAAWLAVRQRDAVENALLLYPPTDFADYLRAVAADDSSLIEAGNEAVEGLMGKPLEELSPDDARVLAFSLPQQVENMADDVPPMFILQGMADTVVPPSQSQRLCNALSGSADHGPAALDGGDPTQGVFRKVYDCDQRGSQLHLFAEAEHVFDVCPLGINCLVGGAQSQQLGRDSLRQGREWLYAGNPTGQAALTPAGEAGKDAGGGALLWPLLLGAAAPKLRRRGQ